VKAVHFPYISGNPYQRLLLAALERRGLSVHRTTTVSELRNVFRSSRPADTVLHLHWLPKGDKGLLNLARLAAYCFRLRRWRGTGVRIIWTVHNLYSHESGSRVRERMLTNCVLRLASGVVVHSSSAERELMHEFPIAERRRVAVIPHGNYIHAYPRDLSPAECRARLGIAPDSRVVGFLGHIRAYKGVGQLVAAFRQLANPDFRLLIAGRPVNPAAETDIREASRGDRRVLFLPGFVADDAIQLYMEASDVVALPYLRVLTSGAAVLAMSFAKPCVAPRSGCLPDFLAQQSELLYDPSDSDDLRLKLHAGLIDRALSQRLGAANLQAATSWSWERIAERLVELYRAAA
jgi:beta-1,4-mannosyltransferase